MSSPNVARATNGNDTAKTNIGPAILHTLKPISDDTFIPLCFRIILNEFTPNSTSPQKILLTPKLKTKKLLSGCLGIPFFLRSVIQMMLEMMMMTPLSDPPISSHDCLGHRTKKLTMVVSFTHGIHVIFSRLGFIDVSIRKVFATMF